MATAYGNLLEASLFTVAKAVLVNALGSTLVFRLIAGNTSPREAIKYCP
jgi:hypothetical protein